MTAPTLNPETQTAPLPHLIATDLRRSFKLGGFACWCRISLSASGPLPNGGFPVSKKNNVQPRL